MRSVVLFNQYILYENGYLLRIDTNTLVKEYKAGSYSKYILSINRKRYNFNTHRLLALHFIPNPHNKEQVNHIDGDKKNNCLSNLEWCTRSENALHSFKVGLQKPTRPVKPIICTKSGAKYESIKEAALKTGINRNSLMNMLNPKNPHKNKTTLVYDKNVSNAAANCKIRIQAKALR